MRELRGNLKRISQGRLRGARAITERAAALRILPANRKTLVLNKVREALRDRIREKVGHTISLSVLKRRDLGILEALVKHLHEDQKLTFSEIARLIDRDARTVWTSYQAALRKSRQPSVSTEGIEVPVSVFADRNMGVLESLVFYLASTGLGYREIAGALARNPKTIYTVLTRAKKKAEMRPVQLELPEELIEIEHEALTLALTLGDVEPVRELILEALEDSQKESVRVPISVFKTRKSGILEALTRYLADEYELTASDIARRIARDPRAVWASIKSARLKESEPERVELEPSVPVSVFSDRSLGVLEALAGHMSQTGMTYREIGKALERDPRTIWTVLKRIRVKRPT